MKYDILWLFDLDLETMTLLLKLLLNIVKMYQNAKLKINF